MKGTFLFLLMCPLVVFASEGTLLSAPDMSQLIAEEEEYYAADPEWPLNLIKINYVDYERNKKASFCVRPIEMVDTIVVHHSETTSTATPEYINDLHLMRGTPEDPWYMVAYSYIVNSPYSGGTIPKAKITEGRPLDIVGAHAGTNIFVPMDDYQQSVWDAKKILCGKENQTPKFDPTLVQGGKIKANVTTIGVVVNGNYSPFSRTNPAGYSKTRPRYPTTLTQDMIARLSCQLQKKYPRMKYLKWHNYYHATSCPGTIKSYIGAIRTMAKRYGCDFK